jgi:hypothetical protein
MFIISLLYLLLCAATAFLGHPSGIAILALILISTIIVVCLVQFATRTFAPGTAAARTSRLNGKAREHLRNVQQFSAS